MVKVKIMPDRFELRYRTDGNNRTLSVPKGMEIKAALKNKDVIVIEITPEGEMKIVDLLRADQSRSEQI